MKSDAALSGRAASLWKQMGKTGMINLYRKNETAFALAWIAIYAAGTGLAESTAAAPGGFRPAPAAFHALLAAWMLYWLKKNGLYEKYGLFLPRYRMAEAWFFLPLAAVAGMKLCFSPVTQHPAADTLLFIVNMMCAGFMEEIIFRGFLFRAIEKSGLKRAVILSAAAFGLAHIANLFSGQNPAETGCQIVFAVIVGFTLVILAYKGKSMVPGILFHGIFNSLSTFQNEEAQFRATGGPVSAQVIMIAAGALILGVYSAWNLKHLTAGGEQRNH